MRHAASWYYGAAGCEAIADAPGGRTHTDPCGGSPCGPIDADVWKDHALAFLDDAATAPLDSSERAQLTTLRTQWADVGGFAFGDSVRSYVAIAQAAACLAADARAREASSRRTPGKSCPPGLTFHPESGLCIPSIGPEAPEEEPWWKKIGLPSLPEFPSFSLPSIPDWLWWVAAGILVLVVLPSGEDKRRRLEAAR
jgi:hypothetical protein